MASNEVGAVIAQQLICSVCCCVGMSASASCVVFSFLTRRIREFYRRRNWIELEQSNLTNAQIHKRFYSKP